MKIAGAGPWGWLPRQSPERAHPLPASRPPPDVHSQWRDNPATVVAAINRTARSIHASGNDVDVSAKLAEI